MAVRRSKDRGNSPDYILKMKMNDRNDKRSHRVGCAWTHDRGRLAVKLDFGVTLHWRDNDDCLLTLWPNDKNGD